MPTPTTVRAVAWRTYSNDDYTYEITYPAGWSVDDDDVKSIYFERPGGGVWVNVFAFQSSADSPSTWLSRLIDRLRSDDSTSLLEVLHKSDNKSYGDGQWAYAIYRTDFISDDCIAERDSTVMLFDQGHDYLLTFSACEEIVEDFEDIFFQMWDDFTPWGW